MLRYGENRDLYVNHCAKIFARNGRKGSLKAVTRKEMAMVEKLRLEKSCKNIHVPPPLGGWIPVKDITKCVGVEILILK